MSDDSRPPLPNFLLRDVYANAVPRGEEMNRYSDYRRQQHNAGLLAVYIRGVEHGRAEAGIVVGAEDWGIVMDALMRERDHATERKAVNSESASNLRAEACERMILAIGAAHSRTQDEVSRVHQEGAEE